MISTKNGDSRSSSADPEPLLEDDGALLNNDALAKSATSDLKDIKPITFEESQTYYTVDDAISKIGNGKFQYRLMFLTGGIWAADAMEMMLLSFVIPIIKQEWNLKPPLDGAISAVVFAGMLCGAAFWSILSDKIGRRKVVIYSNLGCAIFGALSGCVPGIYFMLIARFLVGFSVGGSGTAYTLFAEYAPQEVRGALLVIEQSFWSFGAIFSVLLAWLTLINLSWRWYMIFSSIPLFLIAGFSKWMPESSRYLLAAGKVRDAEKVLQHVAEINGGEIPNGQLKPVKISRRGNPLDAFKEAYRFHSILLYITFFMCVFGYYGISFISVKFFEDVEGGKNDDQQGWKHPKTYWESLISASSELPALFVGAFILDKIGRKISLLIAFGVFAFTSFLLIFEGIHNNTAIGVICVFLARMNISLGFMVLYIYFSEYYPTAIRSTALGMASAIGRIAGMLTSVVSQDTPFKVGILLYAISGGIAFGCSIFLSETMGRAMTTAVAGAPQWWRRLSQRLSRTFSFSKNRGDLELQTTNGNKNKDDDNYQPPDKEEENNEENKEDDDDEEDSLSDLEDDGQDEEEIAGDDTTPQNGDVNYPKLS